MSLPDHTLRKILDQIQTTIATSHKALQIARAQKQSKEREQKSTQLTIAELGAIEGDVSMYKGVGKAFMMVPRQQMDADLRAQEKELAEAISNISKKEKFLEKQFNDAQNQLRDIINSSQRQ